MGNKREIKSSLKRNSVEEETYVNNEVESDEDVCIFIIFKNKR